MGDTSWAWLGICHYCVRKNRGTLVATFQPFTQNGELCYICCSPFGLEGAWILGTLPKHVPSAMFNHFNGGKEEMSIMFDPISPMPIWAIQPSSGHATTSIGSKTCLTHPIGHKHGA
jgi:hypothetical protein